MLGLDYLKEFVVVGTSPSQSVASQLGLSEGQFTSVAWAPGCKTDDDWLLKLEVWLYAAPSVEMTGTIRSEERSMLLVAWIAWMKSSIIIIVGMKNIMRIFHH